MTELDAPRTPGRLPAGNGMGKSIFPTFDVNVPMPRDTAVPGSYKKPAQQSPAGADVAKTVTESN
jgi:hypothetical protein